jgi:hypothetical protein
MGPSASVRACAVACAGYRIFLLGDSSGFAFSFFMLKFFWPAGLCVVYVQLQALFVVPIGQVWKASAFTKNSLETQSEGQSSSSCAVAPIPLRSLFFRSAIGIEKKEFTPRWSLFEYFLENTLQSKTITIRELINER